MQDGTLSIPGHSHETDGRRGDVFARDCPTRQLLDRIGDKWSVLILLSLGDGAMRFSTLKRRIDGISQKMLSQALKALERDGLISRAVEPTVPITVSYAVTPLGAELLGTLQSIINWAETRMPIVAAAQHGYDSRAAG
jgi:DNA-binding HxlR family transcriptional regulator